MAVFFLLLNWFSFLLFLALDVFFLQGKLCLGLMWFHHQLLSVGFTHCEQNVFSLSFCFFSLRLLPLASWQCCESLQFNHLVNQPIRPVEKCLFSMPTVTVLPPLSLFDLGYVFALWGLRGINFFFLHSDLSSTLFFFFKSIQSARFSSIVFSM